MIEELELTAKIYRCNKVAKDLFKDTFDEKIKIYINLLTNYAASKNLTILDAAIELITQFNERDYDAIATMMLMAAVVEIIILDN